VSDEGEHVRARLGTALAPAWRRVTEGENRLAVSLAILVAIGLQLAVPDRLTLSRTWVLPAIEALLLVVLVVAGPWRVAQRSQLGRLGGLVLVAVASLANGWSAGALVRGLIAGTAGDRATPLLVTGGAIWLTNILIFALWFWELDRGGPAPRAAGARADGADFLFPQMATPGSASPDWEPEFVDYLYVAFTNATAFSPTDTMPLTQRAKLLMLAQSLISLIMAALVIARAVNVLK